MGSYFMKLIIYSCITTDLIQAAMIYRYVSVHLSYQIITLK